MTYPFALKEGRARADTRCDMALGEAFDRVLDAARDRAGWAIGALYRELHPSLAMFVRALDPEAGEQIAADAWLEVAGELPAFRGTEDELRLRLFAVARRRLAERPGGERRTLSGDPALRDITVLPADEAEVVLLRIIGGFDAADLRTIIGKKARDISAIQARAVATLAGRR